MSAARQFVKKVLLPATSTIVARPIYALANNLSKISDKRVREYVLYDAIAPSFPTTLMYCKRGPEHFIIDIRDTGGVAKQIFAKGEHDFFDIPNVLGILKIDSLELFIDVGANIGTSCIRAVARGYAKRAIAIEPEPHNCRLLRANIALNGLDNRITVHESACGIQDNETLELALSDEDNIGDHQIRPDGGNGGRKTVKIQSNTLDTSCPDVCDGTLIWMDTQGYEGYVLAGAARWLQAGAPLVMEFAPYLMERNQSFELMKNALAQYASFHDLWRDWGEPERFHPIKELDRLFVQLAEERDAGGAGFTNILVIQ